MWTKPKLPWDQKTVRVAVIGDLILDEYLDGVVNRISPEAPVPVHLVRTTSITAGGAANVARNIQLAGGEALMIGVCGNDGAADQLKQLLKVDAVDIKGVFTDPERPTVRKTRITANHQQLVRVDWEEVRSIPQWMQDELYQYVEKQNWDVMLLSDYGKGGLPREFLQRLIQLARQRQVPVVVDPKGKDYSQYAGATLVTPNRKEACDALGLDNQPSLPALELAEKLHQNYAIENILVTLGAEGMLGLEGKTGEKEQLRAVTREVFDVSGAGDTVVSIMALGLGAKISLFEAMRLANTAAGRVVEKWGTQPILRHELIEALEHEEDHHHFGFTQTSTKIMESRDGRAAIGPIGKRSQKVVFTNGCFDILHAGHISYLEEARSRGHLLVIGVNTDRSVRQLKGASRPIISCDQRMRLLAALQCVDFVVPFDEETPGRLIAEIMPDVLVKGADYEIHQIVGADVVQANGGTVERIQFVEGLSTSDIVRRVQENKGVGLDS
ncbi:MAG: D-glycero-beta-D-manno-heptose 1-phosphate adenylyltransferase [Pseudobdellovibrionaceae bacterium]|nr:D-glycero-beta-D-manno-heptose 1-phosphate adenylyltransferase [Pseudobdellovibrionaceae bacterium]